jgi:predicted protein tyrosine phosphatase
MITKVKVFNRFAMDFAAKMGKDSGFPFVGKPWHLISIHGDSNKFLTDQNVAALKSIGMLGSMSLEFWDVTDDKNSLDAMTRHGYSYILFDNEMAKQVVGFLDRRKMETGDHTLVLHCDAGISRSGAVAEFAAEFYGIHVEVFEKENPYLKPNPLVRRLLRQVAGLAGESAFLTAAEAARDEFSKDIITGVFL